jgi:hypothetical protein
VIAGRPVVTMCAALSDLLVVLIGEALNTDEIDRVVTDAESLGGAPDVKYAVSIGSQACFR